MTERAVGRRVNNLSDKECNRILIVCTICCNLDKCDAKSFFFVKGRSISAFPNDAPL